MHKLISIFKIYLTINPYRIHLKINYLKHIYILNNNTLTFLAIKNIILHQT